MKYLIIVFALALISCESKSANKSRILNVTQADRVCVEELNTLKRKRQLMFAINTVQQKRSHIWNTPEGKIQRDSIKRIYERGRYFIIATRDSTNISNMRKELNSL